MVAGAVVHPTATTEPGVRPLRQACGLLAARGVPVSSCANLIGEVLSGDIPDEEGCYEYKNKATSRVGTGITTRYAC